MQQPQLIIENCLFGVDIDPNSVKICRLRLWIEMLKNAYYQQAPPVVGAESSSPVCYANGLQGSNPEMRPEFMEAGPARELQTLPNIDKYKTGQFPDQLLCPGY